MLLVLLLGALGFNHAMAAVEATVIDPAVDHVDLSASTYLLEDPEGKLRLLDIQSAANAERFRAASPSIGYTTSAYWMRFVLKSAAPQPTTWWLDSGNRSLYTIAFFAPDASGVYRRQSASSTRPFAERPLATSNFVFPLQLPPDRSVTVYMRVRHAGSMGIHVAPQIWQPGAYQKVETEKKMLWTFYLGMAFALGLFNLLLYFYIGDIKYFLYVTLLVSTAWLVSSTANGPGFSFEYFWPGFPDFEQQAWGLSIVATTCSSVLFVTRFLDFRHHLPRLYVSLNASVLLFVVLLGLLIVGALRSPNYAWLVQKVGQASTALFILVHIQAGYGQLALALSGNRLAMQLCAAFAPLGLVAFYGSLADVLGKSYDADMIMWASTFEFIVMSMALAYRFNQEIKAKMQAQTELVETLQRSESELEAKVTQRTLELEQEQNRTKDLLHNILPVELAAELSATGSARPARHESATILFTDFSGFTQAVSTMPADRMVAELNEIFAAFDDITDACGVEKIKTIGDAYMAAAGLPKPCADHAQRCVRAGLRMIDYVEQRNKIAPFKWAIRVGVHSGPVVAGVVGKRKYAFDIWGDTVNVASRMESAGAAGRVNVSAYTFDLIQHEFSCEYRGKVDAKGKGEIDMYFVTGAR